jgi:hypothetical protein
MKGLISFIEKYLNTDSEYSTNIFRVNVDYKIKGGNFLLRDINYRTHETITLDDEDLKYLYDKYYPLYNAEKEKQNLEKEERRLREIKKLQEKIDELNK